MAENHFPTLLLALSADGAQVDTAAAGAPAADAPAADATTAADASRARADVDKENEEAKAFEQMAYFHAAIVWTCTNSPNGTISNKLSTAYKLSIVSTS